MRLLFILFISLLPVTATGCQGMGFGRYFDYMRGEIPSHYNDLINPLTKTTQNILNGKGLFQDHCIQCHGVTGKGDGPIGPSLSSSPANLIFTRTLPIATDGFFFWSISEGGERFDSDMPSFKDILSPTEIWQITHYIKTGL